MSFAKFRKVAALSLVATAAAMSFAPTAQAAATTRYPVVLVHGFIGFDTIVGVNYWNNLPAAIKAAGASKVYVAQVNNSQTPEYRGEELIGQLQAWAATNATQKFNLIGHSLGGPTVRYVANQKPSVVASITTVGGTNLGSAVADYTIDKGYISEGNWLDSIGTPLLKLLAWASTYSGNSEDINAFVAAKAMTTAEADRFNTENPLCATDVRGQPAGPEQAGGIYCWSVTGNAVGTNSWDPSDLILKATETVGLKGKPNDGLVQLESQYWGKHVGTFAWNHLDEIYHVLGLIGKTAANPKDVYAAHVTRMISKGL